MEVHVTSSCPCLRCVLFICSRFTDEVDNPPTVHRVSEEKRNELQFDEDEESKFKGSNTEKQTTNL